MLKKHIRDPLTNYQLLPFWLTAIRNGFRNFCLNIWVSSILRNFQSLSHMAFQSTGPTGNKDSAKEKTPDFWMPCKNATYLKKLNFSKCFHLNRAANDYRNGMSHSHPKRSKRWEALSRPIIYHFPSKYINSISWSSPYNILKL